MNKLRIQSYYLETIKEKLGDHLLEDLILHLRADLERNQDETDKKKGEAVQVLNINKIDNTCK